MSVDRTAEWKAAKALEPEPKEILNEHGEELSVCMKRLIREHGVNAEKEASRLAMYHEGWPSLAGRDYRLVAYYRVVARMVRIDNG